jgi:hypothetical protein
MLRKNQILICLFSLLALLVLPGVASADCIEVQNFDTFALQGDGIVLYSGSTPLVKIQTDCNVYPQSRIILLKNYLCDGGGIQIDGSTCMMVSVSLASEN